MKSATFAQRFATAIAAGKKRDYKTSIVILEDLAAQGFADGTLSLEPSSSEAHPEVYLFLARAWHAEKSFARATSCARAYIGLNPDDGAGWFFLGRSYFADGAVERAIHALRKSISLNPESIDARALLGLALLKGRRPIQARTLFEESLSLAPDDPRLNQGYLNALFVEAVRTYRKGDAETARQMLTFLINNDIDGVVPRLYLAHALRQLGYLEESLGQYEAAVGFSPEDPALRWYPIAVLAQMGETDRAAQAMVDLGEPPPAGDLSARAIALRIVKGHLDAAEWAQAAQACRSWLKGNDGDAQAHALMAEALRNSGSYDASLAHFNRALALDRSNPSPYYGVILVLMERKEWKALKSVLDRAERSGLDRETVEYYRVLAAANLDESPESILPGIQEQVRQHGASPELVGALARAYFRLGLSELAVGWYEKAISFDENDENAFLGYIACCEELGDDVKITAAYDDYLRRWPDNAAIRRDYAAYLAALDRWISAADQLEALQGYASAPQADRQIALYRRKAGQFRQAAILYRSMLRKKPDDRNLLANLVFCLDRMGETKSAIVLMREANRAYAPDVESSLIEGRLLAKSGDLNGALAVFRKTIDSFPDDVRGWNEVSAVYARQGVPEMAATFAEKARDIALKGKRRRAP